HTIGVDHATRAAPADIADEPLLAGAAPLPACADPGENTAAAMCYTTGTTGNPKGVLYSHRSLVLHSLGLALDHCMGIRETDVMLPVVPMFHANAWGMPFTAVMVRAALGLPRPPPPPPSVRRLFHPAP